MTHEAWPSSPRDADASAVAVRDFRLGDVCRFGRLPLGGLPAAGLIGGIGVYGQRLGPDQSAGTASMASAIA